MKTGKTSQIIWRENKNNPLIEPPFLSPIIADPTFLPPSETPDQKWHLFAHSIFGIHHYLSLNGIDWQLQPGLISFLSLRPFLYRENGLYYLLYEKLDSVLNFPSYNSHLEIRSSFDLKKWSEPKTILTPTLPWQKTPPSLGNLGNPSLIKSGDTYILSYSAGLFYVPDNHFTEPYFTALARSKNLLGPYLPDQNPKDKTIVASRAYADNGIFLGLQTYYYFDQTNHSHAAIRLVRSKNGIDWEKEFQEIILPDKPWKKTHVYVGDLRQFKGKYYLYYNARDGWFWGKERIGLTIGTILKP